MVQHAIYDIAWNSRSNRIDYFHFQTLFEEYTKTDASNRHLLFLAYSYNEPFVFPFFVEKVLFWRILSFHIYKRGKKKN